MSLLSVMAEIEDGQSHQAMLIEIKNRKVIQYEEIVSGRIRGYLASIGVLASINDVANDPNNKSVQLRNLCLATMQTLQPGGGIDFNIPETYQMLEALCSAFSIDDTHKQNMLKLGEIQVPEFPNVSLRDVIQAREPDLVETSYSNTLDLSNQRGRPQLVKVTVQTDLPEAVNLKYEIKNGNSMWQGSGIQNLRNIQYRGDYYVRLPGEIIMSNIATLRIASPYNVPLVLSKEGV